MADPAKHTKALAGARAGERLPGRVAVRSSCRLGLLAAALLLGRGAELVAGERPQGTGFVFRGGGGLLNGATEVAGERSSKTGLGLNAQLAVSKRTVEWALDLEIQPFTVDNPVKAEAFRVVYVLPSFRVHGRNVFLRAGLGLAQFSFSGPEANVSSESGIGIGLSAGYELERPRRFPLTIEVVGRWGSTPDLELGARGLGVQVVGSWYSKKPS